MDDYMIAIINGSKEDDGKINYLGKNPSIDVIRKALDDYIFSTKEFRQNLQNQMLSKDLKNGRKNVMNIILNL